MSTTTEVKSLTPYGRSIIKDLLSSISETIYSLFNKHFSKDDYITPKDLHSVNIYPKEAKLALGRDYTTDNDYRCRYTIDFLFINNNYTLPADTKSMSTDFLKEVQSYTGQGKSLQYVKATEIVGIDKTGEAQPQIAVEVIVEYPIQTASFEKFLTEGVRTTLEGNGSNYIDIMPGDTVRLARDFPLISYGYFLDDPIINALRGKEVTVKSVSCSSRHDFFTIRINEDSGQFSYPSSIIYKKVK